MEKKQSNSNIDSLSTLLGILINFIFASVTKNKLSLLIHPTSSSIMILSHINSFGKKSFECVKEIN